MARRQGGRPTEAWDTRCTSQCPMSPGAAGSPGSERKTAAANSLTAWQKLILVHTEITPAQDWGGGRRRHGHPRTASTSSVAVFVWVTPGCRGRRQGRGGAVWAWGHGDSMEQGAAVSRQPVFRPSLPSLACPCEQEMDERNLIPLEVPLWCLLSWQV